MISLSEHIEYLIHRHDCVIVPGWGAFVANYQPARIDADTHCIVPPSRHIGFNPALTHNDGMIASSIVRQRGITYDNAVEIISEEVNTIRHQFNFDGEVAIGRIGIFKKSDEGSTIFEPYQTSDNEFYGLQPIKATPLLAIAKDEKSEDNDEATNHRDVFYLPISRNIFKIAASIALLIGLGFTLSTPIIKDNDSNYAGVATVSTPKAKTVEIVDRNDAELFIALPDTTDSMAIADTTEVVSSKAIANEITATDDNIRLNDNDNYCLIVASHATRQQAEKQIAGNPDLRILESGGRFRVYAATGNSIAEARAAMSNSEFAQKHPDAWVCRR